MTEPEHCPNKECNDQGWYGELIHQGYDDYGYDIWEPQQVQCEWCYTTPDSVFNYETRKDT